MQDIKIKYQNNLIKCLILFIIIILIFTLRYLYSTVVILDWDEGVYFTLAQDIVNGGIPYLTSWDNKGPILYFMFALIIKLFGNNIFPLRIFTTFYLLISMIFIYLIANKFTNSKASLFAPLIYGLFFTTSKFGGLASNSEIFMMLPAIIATYCFISYKQNRNLSTLMLYLCGFFSALAFFIKGSIIFTVAISPIILITHKLKSQQYTWKLFLKDMFVFVSGAMTPTLILLYYLYFHNALADFYYAYFIFNNQQISTITWLQGTQKLIDFLYYAITNDFITITAFVLFFIALIYKYYKKDFGDNFLFILLLFFLSLIGVYLGRNIDRVNYAHYFLQMGLPFTLMILISITILETYNKWFHNIIILILLVIISIIFYKYCIPLNKYLNAKFQANDPCNIIAAYISANTKKEDTIFVRGDTIIYFLSARKAPTKYFSVMFHLYRSQYILNPKENTLRAFAKNKPKYFVYRDFEWAKNKYAGDAYLKDFMLANYHIEKIFESYTPGEPYYLYKVNLK